MTMPQTQLQASQQYSWCDKLQGAHDEKIEKELLIQN